MQPEVNAKPHLYDSDITVKYTNDADGASPELLTHMIEWNRVPDQSKMLDKAKEMIDILYQQVR